MGLEAFNETLLVDRNLTALLTTTKVLYLRLLSLVIHTRDLGLERKGQRA
jgi:hypothetical protein